MAWQTIGDIGGIASVDVDREAGYIVIHSQAGSLIVNVVDAARLAILLDEATALAKGEGAKLDKGLA
jgi:hypothetical protein